MPVCQTLLPSSEMFIGTTGSLLRSESRSAILPAQPIPSASGGCSSATARSGRSANRAEGQPLRVRGDLAAVLDRFNERADVGDEGGLAGLEERGHLRHAAMNGEVRQTDRRNREQLGGCQGEIGSRTLVGRVGRALARTSMLKESLPPARKTQTRARYSPFAGAVAAASRPAAPRLTRVFSTGSR